MRKIVIACLLATHVAATAQPAFAADLIDQATPRIGAFAGARLRMPLGHRGHQRLRVGLTIAPTTHASNSDGAVRTRFGEGLELGVAQDRPIELSLAGTRLDRFGVAPNGKAPGGPRAGISAAGWIAIGVGAAVLAVAAAGVVWHDALNCDTCD